MGESPKTEIARLWGFDKDIAAARAESKHWCDHATKLVDDLIAADEQRAEARGDAAAVRVYASRLEAALVRAHACPTVRDDGECDGCFVSEALASAPGEGPQARGGQGPYADPNPVGGKP